jgi:hypothetical protein
MRLNLGAIMSDLEFHDYFAFTGPARLSKSIHVLEGLLQGVTIDKEITPGELASIQSWINANREFSNRHPFNELLPILESAIVDKTIDNEELSDILWCCRKLIPAEGFYADVTADMQRLQGILAGVIADGVVTEREARNLSDWLEDYSELKTVWPYAELESVLTKVLADGKIDETEQKELLAVFGEFSGLKTKPRSPLDIELPKTVQGICAVSPSIGFAGKTFCLTGESERWTKSGFGDVLSKAAAIYHPRVVATLDYLVVGSAGNPCWAYACYGRKVEAAVKLRQQGKPLLIVHEYDVWDALQDAGIQD